MESLWKVLCFVLGLISAQLCNGLPINLTTSGPDPHTQYLTGLVAVLLAICSIVLLAGCVCCRRYKNGFTEFRDSPVVASVASNLDHGHVNPIANSEFTIFTPISPTHHNNNVFLANQRIVNRTQEDLKYGDIDVSLWFDGSEKDFPRTRLKYIRELGKGWFGRVVEGTAQGLSQDPGEPEWTPVVVRILEASASSKERVLFLHDADVYRHGYHPNVLMLLGRCLDMSPLLLLQEYCTEGDLKKYLRSMKPTKEKFLSSDLPLLWCYQLTQALKFLHEQKVPHSDLAARNCQLTKDLTLKLGDYGLNSSFYPEDYYQGSLAVPLRWCAPENISYTNTTIQTKKVTLEGNIWSFGVTMWEILECGDQPYSDLNDDDVISQVLGTANIRLLRPTFNVIYTDYLYKLMQSCWSTAESRPSATHIDLILNDLMQVYEHTKVSTSHKQHTSIQDFDQRWEALKPNILITDETPLMQEDKKSGSLTNLHGSLDNLLEDQNPMDSWLENVANNTGDLVYTKGLSEAMMDLDNALELSSDSNQPSPRPLHFKIGSKVITSSESETEDENWKKKIECGAYTEKVRQKSRSVADLMILTHVDYSESDSETLPSLTEYKNQKPKYLNKNMENPALKFGSEGNLLSVHDTFQEELRKLQDERRDSLLFVPDKYSYTDSKPAESSSSRQLNSLENSPVKKLIVELNSPSEIIPPKQVYNVFNVSVKHLNNLGGIDNKDNRVSSQRKSSCDSLKESKDNKDVSHIKSNNFSVEKPVICRDISCDKTKDESERNDDAFTYQTKIPSSLDRKPKSFENLNDFHVKIEILSDQSSPVDEEIALHEELDRPGSSDDYIKESRKLHVPKLSEIIQRNVTLKSSAEDKLLLTKFTDKDLIDKDSGLNTPENSASLEKLYDDIEEILDEPSVLKKCSKCAISFDENEVYTGSFDSDKSNDLKVDIHKDLCLLKEEIKISLSEGSGCEEDSGTGTSSKETQSIDDNLSAKSLEDTLDTINNDYCLRRSKLICESFLANEKSNYSPTDEYREICFLSNTKNNSINDHFLQNLEEESNKDVVIPDLLTGLPDIHKTYTTNIDKDDKIESLTKYLLKPLIHIENFQTIESNTNISSSDGLNLTNQTLILPIIKSSCNDKESEDSISSSKSDSADSVAEFLSPEISQASDFKTISECSADGSQNNPSAALASDNSVPNTMLDVSSEEMKTLEDADSSKTLGGDSDSDINNIEDFAEVHVEEHENVHQEKIIGETKQINIFSDDLNLNSNKLKPNQTNRLSAILEEDPPKPSQVKRRDNLDILRKTKEFLCQELVFYDKEEIESKNKNHSDTFFEDVCNKLVESVEDTKELNDLSRTIHIKENLIIEDVNIAVCPREVSSEREKLTPNKVIEEVNLNSITDESKNSLDHVGDHDSVKEPLGQLEENCEPIAKNANEEMLEGQDVILNHPASSLIQTKSEPVIDNITCNSAKQSDFLVICKSFPEITDTKIQSENNEVDITKEMNLTEISDETCQSENETLLRQIENENILKLENIDISEKHNIESKDEQIQSFSNSSNKLNINAEDNTVLTVDNQLINNDEEIKSEDCKAFLIKSSLNVLFESDDLLLLVDNEDVVKSEIVDSLSGRTDEQLSKECKYEDHKIFQMDTGEIIANSNSFDDQFESCDKYFNSEIHEMPPKIVKGKSGSSYLVDGAENNEITTNQEPSLVVTSDCVFDQFKSDVSDSTSPIKTNEKTQLKNLLEKFITEEIASTSLTLVGNVDKKDEKFELMYKSVKDSRKGENLKLEESESRSQRKNITPEEDNNLFDHVDLKHVSHKNSQARNVDNCTDITEKESSHSNLTKSYALPKVNSDNEVNKEISEKVDVANQVIENQETSIRKNSQFKKDDQETNTTNKNVILPIKWFDHVELEDVSEKSKFDIPVTNETVIKDVDIELTTENTIATLKNIIEDIIESIPSLAHVEDDQNSREENHNLSKTYETIPRGVDKENKYENNKLPVKILNGENDQMKNILDHVEDHDICVKEEHKLIEMESLEVDDKGMDVPNRTNEEKHQIKQFDQNVKNHIDFITEIEQDSSIKHECSTDGISEENQLEFNKCLIENSGNLTDIRNVDKQMGVDSQVNEQEHMLTKTSDIIGNKEIKRVDLEDIVIDLTTDNIKCEEGNSSNSDFNLRTTNEAINTVNSDAILKLDESPLNEIRDISVNVQEIDESKMETTDKVEKFNQTQTILNKTKEFLNNEIEAYIEKPKEKLPVQFDLSDSQEEIAPNSLTHFQGFTSTPFSKKRSLESTVILGASDDYSIDYYSGLKTAVDPVEAEELKFSSNFMQESPRETINDLYSLETWDNFLGKSFDEQENDLDFITFNQEPHSLLFLENDNNAEFDNNKHEKTNNLQVSKVINEAYVPESSKTVEETFRKDSPLDKTYDAGKQIGNTTFTKNDATFVKEDSSITDDVKPSTSTGWESGGGWFLHPQSNSEELSGQIAVQEQIAESYVGFSMDDEIMAAIRNELLNKLPHAQRASSEQVEEMEELEPAEKNEVFIRYNVYNTPLSPIPEESYVDSDDESPPYTPKRLTEDSDDDSSDWSIEDNISSNLHTEINSPKLESSMISSPAKMPNYRHTPSQDSCCSNDTLFNIEDLNLAIEHDRIFETIPDEDESSSKESKYSDCKAEVEESEDKTLVDDEEKEDEIKKDVEIPKISIHDYITDFLNKERYNQLNSCIELSDLRSEYEECSSASDKYLTVSDNTLSFGQNVAPLNSPEDRQWKDLQASFRGCEETNQNQSLKLNKTYLTPIENAECDEDLDKIGINFELVTDLDDPDLEDCRISDEDIDKVLQEDEDEKLVVESTMISTEEPSSSDNKLKDNISPNLDNESISSIQKEDNRFYINMPSEPEENSPIIDDSKLGESPEYVYVEKHEDNHEYENGWIADTIYANMPADRAKELDYVIAEENKKAEENIEDLYGPLADIRFSGPGLANLQMMSTSFSESNEVADEQDWDSGSDTRSSSSGEFIWRNTQETAPMEDIQEENESSSSDSDGEGDCPEFVPSAWDKYAIPAKSALRSPEKTFERKDPKDKKAVCFKKQKYHCIYEYPKEPDSPILQSYDLWKPTPDYATLADWELGPDMYVPRFDLIDSLTSVTDQQRSPKNLYHLTAFPEKDPTILDDDFYVSSSSKPFDMLGGLTSQFFPGRQFSDHWLDAATPDSGDEVLPPLRENNRIPTLKHLATIAANKTHSSRELGGLRHTRSKLKLDLPPSPSAFSSNTTFLVEPIEEVVPRQVPTFSTFGKSRFLVQHVDTPPDDKTSNKNVSFEALPYKPQTQTVKERHTIELVRGEANLLDSADEDSGIDSSTLERGKRVVT